MKCLEAVVISKRISMDENVVVIKAQTSILSPSGQANLRLDASIMEKWAMHCARLLKTDTPAEQQPKAATSASAANQQPSTLASALSLPWSTLVEFSSAVAELLQASRSCFPSNGGVLPSIEGYKNAEQRAEAVM